MIKDSKFSYLYWKPTKVSQNSIITKFINLDESGKQERELMITTITKLARDNKILRKGVLI
jgi:hypothetical protein